MVPSDTGRLRSHCLTAVFFVLLTCSLIYLHKATALFNNNEVKCQENSSRILRDRRRVFSTSWGYRSNPPPSLLHSLRPLCGDDINIYHSLTTRKVIVF